MAEERAYPWQESIASAAATFFSLLGLVLLFLMDFTACWEYVCPQVEEKNNISLIIGGVVVVVGLISTVAAWTLAAIWALVSVFIILAALEAVALVIYTIKSESNPTGIPGLFVFLGAIIWLAPAFYVVKYRRPSQLPQARPNESGVLPVCRSDVQSQSGEQA